MALVRRVFLCAVTFHGLITCENVSAAPPPTGPPRSSAEFSSASGGGPVLGSGRGTNFTRREINQPIGIAPGAGFTPPEPLPPVSTTPDARARVWELNLARLIDEVQSRNSSVQAMVATGRAAAERYPQVVSLNDPMFGFMLGPASWASNDVEGAYMVEARQQIPWPGKRAARGRGAQAEAQAASLDIVDTRLRIREATQIAFYDYYLSQRDLELNRQNLEAVDQFRQSARTRYESNQATQQDYLQAEVELADIERRQIEIERMHRIAVARINTLLRVPPNAPLAPPPRSLSPPTALPPAEVLHQVAVQQRPDLAALNARIQAEQAAEALACREYYPDLEVVGRYDAFWQRPEQDLRPQVGMNMNVPLYKDRRRAAVREASFRVAQRQAEFQQRITDIHYDVHAGYEQVRESLRTIELYDRRFLPVAQQNVDSARVNYDVGKTTFLDLIQAQRQVIAVRQRQQEAIADYHRRKVVLERAIAGPLPETVEETVSPAVR